MGQEKKEKKITVLGIFLQFYDMFVIFPYFYVLFVCPPPLHSSEYLSLNDQISF